MTRSWSLMTMLFVALAAVACGASDADESESSEDDLVATFDRSGRIDLAKTTHILLVGDSDELGAQPLRAATTRARRYAQLYPNDQVVLFITKDATDAQIAQTGATLVQQEPFGSAVTLSDLTALRSDKLVAALARFQRIASLDFFGHSSPFGALLEAEGDVRSLGPGMPGNLAALASRFARDRNPYVTLNGCNGGVSVAAALSKMWQLPVSGALTASNFEVLMNDGRWYPDDPKQIAPGLSRVSKNNRSFGPQLTPSCSSGACVRMKPQNAPYWGVWSRPEGFQFGINYYKFFCDYVDPNNTCAKGMATSLYAFPSVKPIDSRSSDADFTEVLADFFCSSSSDPTWFDTCKSGLLQAAATGAAFSPMKVSNAYTLECDFAKCQQKFRCDVVGGVPQKHSCVWVDASCAAGADPKTCRTKNTSKQTSNHEITRYLAGHRLLRGR